MPYVYNSTRSRALLASLSAIKHGTSKYFGKYIFFYLPNGHIFFPLLFNLSHRCINITLRIFWRNQKNDFQSPTDEKTMLLGYSFEHKKSVHCCCCCCCRRFCLGVGKIFLTTYAVQFGLNRQKWLDGALRSSWKPQPLKGPVVGVWSFLGLSTENNL